MKPTRVMEILHLRGARIGIDFNCQYLRMALVTFPGILLAQVRTRGRLVSKHSQDYQVLYHARGNLGPRRCIGCYKPLR